MILPVATVLSVILYTSFALTAFADDIAPRAGIGGAVGGGGGSGGRGGGAGGGSGTKSSKGKPKDHEHNGGSSNSKGTKLTKLDKFPAPESLMISDDDAASVFSLGSFKEQDDQVLFENFDGHTLPFFSKMYDFFAAKETYLETVDAYADATGKQDPFRNKKVSRPTGQRITVTETVGTAELPATPFNPAKATDACYAWSSLHAYCDGAGQDCACSSGAFYVPDQYNSIADGCASVTTKCGDDAAATDARWCAIGKSAAKQTTYCDSDESAVKFAATAAAVEATPTPDEAPGPNDAPTTKKAAPEETDGPEETSTPEETNTSKTEAPSATETMSSSSRPTLVFIESTTGFSFPPFETSASASAGSWAARSLDPAVASTCTWAVLLMALVLL